jgi:hypothetical protein
MSNDDTRREPPRTLLDTDIQTSTVRNRRALLRAAGLAVLVSAVGGPSAAQTGITDQDQGAGADPPRNGRGGPGSRPQGQSDNDPSDPPGRSGGSCLSDTDMNPNADPQCEGAGTAAWARRHPQGR